jgi:L-alanine-DL-glutamate epimerase-like enolase superfamily enzyme
MPALPIRSVETVRLQLPLARPISSALGEYRHVDCLVVLVHTADGPSGVGFNAGLGGAAGSALAPYIEEELAPLAVGQDALAPEALWARLWGPNKARMRGGLGVWALSAIDIACWDVVAKAAGLPLHRLLGGYRARVPVYGSGGWHNLTDAELVDECEAFAAEGITAYKYKIGTPRDRERTQLLRRAMGDGFMLLADANQGYDVRGAVEASHMLAEFGVGWLEEPVLADTPEDLARVAAASTVPVAAGENVYFRWGFRRLCELGAAAFLQPDVARCGGVTEFRKIAHLAEAHRVSLSSHLWHELSVSLVGASPAGWRVEYAPLIPPDALTRPFQVVGGAIEVPDTPGHGVEFTEAALRHFAVP